MQKNDIEKYKEMLKTIFEGKNKMRRDELIRLIIKSENCEHREAERILNYCRTKKIVISKHLYSTYFEYSLNF